ncbi:MAG: PQQ-like beta-propeller repeat protein, partial [Saccharospirillaceae bacterium]|nr:PQQ-like beta-propeller repeat protein [Saccharospirillaceae bacterium]
MKFNYLYGVFLTLAFLGCKESAPEPDKKVPTVTVVETQTESETQTRTKTDTTSDTQTETDTTSDTLTATETTTSDTLTATETTTSDTLTATETTTSDTLTATETTTSDTLTDTETDSDTETNTNTNTNTDTDTDTDTQVTVSLGEDFGQWKTAQANHLHNGEVEGEVDVDNIHEIWNFPLSSSYSSSNRQGAAADGKLFFVRGSTLYALESINGTEVWSVNVTANHAPAYDDGIVYLETGSHSSANLYGFNSSDGSLTFKQSISDQFSTFYAPTIYDGHVYFNGGSYGGLYSANAKTGVIDWFKPLAQYDSYTPLVVGDKVYPYAGNTFSVLDRETGDTETSITSVSGQIYAMRNSPMLGDQNNAISIISGYLISFDLTNNVENWRYSNSFSGQPVAQNGIIYAISSGVVISINESTGEKIENITTESNYANDLLLVDNKIFAQSSTKTVVIDLETNAVVWQGPGGGSMLIGEGVLYIFESNQVSAYDLDGDADEDGVLDYIEKLFGKNVDPLSDLDNDGLTFIEEINLNTDPGNPDSDSDGLTDGEEVLTYFTDPLNQDTDSDSLNDYDEVVTHNSNPLSTDSDQDGLTDYLEVLHSLDPNDPTDASADFDMDGVPNDIEIFSNSDLRSNLSKPDLNGWTMVQGNSMHNGYHPVKVDPANISVRWSVTDTSFNTQPIAMDFGTIYAKHDSDILAAYNQIDGSLKWKIEVDSDSRLSGPTVSDQTVLLHSGGHSNTFLRAFDKQTGDVVYKNSHGSQWPSYSAPTLYKDIVFMNGGYYGGMLAKDLATGATLWSVSSSIAGWTDSWEPAVNEDAVYLVSSGSKLTALDRLTGEVSYQITTPSPIYIQTLAVSSNGNVCAKGKSIVCFDTENQEILWTSATDSSGYTNLAIGRGIVFAKKSST